MGALMGRVRLIGLCLAGVVAAGCGQRELSKPTAHPVQGKLTAGGKPLAFVGIELVPKQGSKGMTALGKTDADGVFVLRTTSNDEPDGAVPGEYTVKLSPWDAVEHGALPRGAKPAKITPNLAKTDLTVEIKAEENDLTIDIP